jgi:hypothetical protein
LGKKNNQTVNHMKPITKMNDRNNEHPLRKQICYSNAAQILLLALPFHGISTTLMINAEASIKQVLEISWK